MLRRRPARGPEEGQEDQPPRVKAGQQRGEGAEDEGDRAVDGAAGKRTLEDRILRVKPCEPEHARDADPGDRQRPRDHGPEGNRDLFTQRPIIAHVLLMVHRVDHRSRAEKQQRLEESVGEKVEHRRPERACASGEEHVAKLRAGRIGDDALDVVLHAADGRGENASGGADVGNDGHRDFAGDDHRRQAADHEHACGDHRGGVNEGGHRGRPLHRVGQPGVEAQLRRLAHRADEQQQRQDGHRVRGHSGKVDGGPGHAGGGREDRRDRDRPEHQEGPENAERKAEVANAVDDKRLDRGGVCAGFVIPEPDQEIGGEPDPFPADEHLHQRVGGDQHQHGEGEQREVSEEARLAVVLGHIAPAVEVDEARYRGHDDQHHRGQSVDLQCPVDIHPVRLDPVEDVNRRRLGMAGEKADEDRPRQRARREQGAGGDDLGRNFADDPPTKSRDERG